MNELGAFTTDALLAEIVRRRNADETETPIQHWCEDCAHFRYSKSESDTANNCQKGHAMQFRMPEDWPEDDYGFYRRVCADRTAKPVPLLPPPPARPTYTGPRIVSKT